MERKPNDSAHDADKRSCERFYRIGFKRASFQRAVPAQLDGPGFAVRFQPLVENRTDIVDLKAGTRIDTGNPLDVALNGQTVMGVLTDQGQLAFTRRGDLQSF